MTVKGEQRATITINKENNRGMDELLFMKT
jgi:hypothetical protein